MNVRRYRLVALLAVTACIVLLPRAASAQDVPDFGQLAGFIRWSGVVVSVLVLVGAAVLIKLVSGVATRASTRFASRRLLIQKVESFLHFAIYVAAGAVCVGLSFRLDSTALTVIGGALAFAVGFAMRDLVAAFIAGVLIMFDRPFQVGDRVDYAGQYGDIIKIGLRSVQMNTLDHNIVTIPNNKVLTDVTSCGNYGALEMQVPMDFFIGADQDVRRACELVREACLTSSYVFLSKPAPVTVKQEIRDNHVAFHIKARPYVLDTKYETLFVSDVHLRVSDAFRQHRIMPPAILHRSLAGSETEAPSPSPPTQRPKPN